MRELENVIRRVCVVAKGDVMLLRDLPPEVAGEGARGQPGRCRPGRRGRERGFGPGRPSRGSCSNGRGAIRTLKIIPAVERELVIQALKETDGNQVHAAKLLGITRATLRKRVEKFGIQRELSIK